MRDERARATEKQATEAKKTYKNGIIINWIYGVQGATRKAFFFFS